MMRVVLDTNVLIGVDRNLFFLYARQNRYEIIWSSFIEEEMRRVMRRIGWRPSKANTVISITRSLATFVNYNLIEGGNYDVWLLDVDDHPIMKTALIGNADYLVTNNTKDFPPKKRYAGITMITPDAFLRLLET